MRLLVSPFKKKKRQRAFHTDENEILHAIARDRPILQILELLALKMEQWFQGKPCSIYLLDQEKLRFAAVVAPSLPELLRGVLQNMAPQDVLQGAVAKAGVPQFEAAEFEAIPHRGQTAQIFARCQLYPCYARPIISSTGDLLGQLEIYSRKNGDSFTEVARFEQVLNIVSIAIERWKLNKELRKLSGLVIEAQEAERRRIARDLHDSVNQILSSAAFRIGLIDVQYASQNKDTKEELERIKLLLTKAIDEIHRISDDLRPSELDTFGLVPAIRNLCQEFQRRTNLALKIECDPASMRLPSGVELTLYRIVQEALNNIGKHAEASHVALRLRWEEAFVQLNIKDNGKGLESPLGRIHQPRKVGMGLLNMRERTAFFGGIFSIQSQKNKGTEINVRIPASAPEQKPEGNL